MAPLKDPRPLTGGGDVRVARPRRPGVSSQGRAQMSKKRGPQSDTQSLRKAALEGTYWVALSDLYDAFNLVRRPHEPGWDV